MESRGSHAVFRGPAGRLAHGNQPDRANSGCVFATPSGPIAAVQGVTMQQQYQSDLTIYSGELQQIWQTPEHNTILGTRIQYGDFDTHNLQTGPSALPFIFPGPPANAADQQFTSMFNRISVYGYHQWQVFDPLQLIGGVAYDRLSFPGKFLDVRPFPEPTRP